MSVWYLASVSESVRIARSRPIAAPRVFATSESASISAGCQSRSSSHWSYPTKPHHSPAAKIGTARMDTMP